MSWNRSDNPILNKLNEYSAEEDVEVVKIEDSRAARRIIDGVQEGRDIIVTLERIGVI